MRKPIRSHPSVLIGMRLGFARLVGLCAPLWPPKRRGGGGNSVLVVFVHRGPTLAAEKTCKQQDPRLDCGHQRTWHHFFHVGTISCGHLLNQPKPIVKPLVYGNPRTRLLDSISGSGELMFRGRCCCMRENGTIHCMFVSPGTINLKG